MQPSDDDKRRERIADVLPHLRLSATMAQLQEPEGEVHLAVIVKKPDGSGRMVASFQFEDFLSDLEALFPESKGGS